MILLSAASSPRRVCSTWVDACARLRDRQVRFQCCIVGKGNDLERVRHTIATQGLGRHVTCAGLRPHSELAQWFRASDVVALPSYNGGHNVLREAIACGRPFVSTGLGVFRKCRSSLSRLTNAGDVEGLATSPIDLNDPLDVDSGLSGESTSRGRSPRVDSNNCCWTLSRHGRSRYDQ